MRGLEFMNLQDGRLPIQKRTNLVGCLQREIFVENSQVIKINHKIKYFTLFFVDKIVETVY